MLAYEGSPSLRRTAQSTSRVRGMGKSEEMYADAMVSERNVPWRAPGSQGSVQQKPIPIVSAAEQAQAGQSLQSRFGSVGNLQPLSAGLSHSRPPAALHVKGPGDLLGHPAGISLWQPIPGSAASPSFTARHTDYLRPSPPRSAETAPAVQQALAVPGLSIASARATPTQEQAPADTASRLEGRERAQGQKRALCAAPLPRQGV